MCKAHRCCTRRLGGVHECGMAAMDGPEIGILHLGPARARDPGQGSWGYPSLAPAGACEKWMMTKKKKNKRLEGGIDHLVSLISNWTAQKDMSDIATRLGLQVSIALEYSAR